MAKRTDAGATHLSVLVSLGVNCAETLALEVAAGISGSIALRAQTAANAADVGVQVFLLIGVLSSIRPPDDAPRRSELLSRHSERSGYSGSGCPEKSGPRGGGLRCETVPCVDQWRCSGTVGDRPLS
jgi:hypothetical protein